MSRPLKPLTSRLWSAQSQFANTNSGIILGGESVCLIDPGILPIELKAFTDFIASRQVHIEYLILTHSHWDHLFGPEWFPGVPVIAHENFDRAMQGEAAGKILRYVERLTTHFEIEREKPFVIPHPDQTISEMKSLELEGLEITLIHTPGHAEDHLSIYLPEDGTLWAGDILSDEEIPYIMYSLDAYEATLAKLAELDIRCIVPGHGIPTLDASEIKSRLSNDRAYLARLHEQVERAVAEGLNVEETGASCSGFTHPSMAENQNPHKLNIESVYIELGGEADLTRVGWNQKFD